MVLEVIGPHGLVALVRHLPLRRGCGRLDVVRGACSGQIKDLPAAKLQPVAEVDVLAEHEVARIEEPDPLQRGRAQHQACAGSRVHLVHFRFWEMPHVVAAEARAVWEQLAQAHRAVEHRAGHRERSPRIGIPAPVRQQHPGTHGAGVGTRQQEVGQPADALRIHGHIRGQEEDEPALAALEPQVGGTAVAQVLRLHEHRRLRELICHGCRGPIGRVVVDDHRLHRYVRAREERMETLEKEFFGVVADDQRRHQWLGLFGHREELSLSGGAEGVS